jgi:hypothetical protein
MRIRLFGGAPVATPELFKADRRLDVVAQDYLAGFHVARKHRVDAVAQKRLGEFRVALDVVLNQFLEAFGSCHLRFASAYAALASFVVLPIGDRRVDVALLPLLRSAGQQDKQWLPVARKIDPISRAEIDLVFQHALADGFYVGKIALLHPGDDTGNLGARYRVQIRKPFSERLVAIRSYVITDFEHEYW